MHDIPRTANGLVDVDRLPENTRWVLHFCAGGNVLMEFVETPDSRTVIEDYLGVFGQDIVYCQYPN